MEETSPDLKLLNRSLTIQIGHMFAGRAGAMFFSFLLPVLLVRILSVEDFGAYKQLFLLFSTLIVLFCFGLDASLYYFLPIQPEKKDVFISQTLLLYLVIGTTFFSLSFLFDELLASLIGNPSLSTHIPLVMLFTVLMLISSPLETIMISLRQARKASLVIFFSEASKAFLFVGPAILFGTVASILAGAILLAAARVTLLAIYLSKQVGISLQRIRFGHFRPQIRYAFPFWLATIFVTLADTSHFYIVSYLFGVTSFAVYSVGFTQIALGAVLFESVVSTSMVGVAEYAAKRDFRAVAFLVSGVTKKLFIVFLPVFCFLSICAREFVLLIYTAKFEQSVPIVLVSLFILPISSFNLSYVLRSLGNTKFILVTGIVRLILTVLLVIILSRYLQLIGAGVGVVVAQLAANCLLLIEVLRISKLHLRELFSPEPLCRVLISCVAASALAGILKLFLDASPAMLLGFTFLTFAPVYATLIYHFHLIDEEVEILRTFARRILAG